MINKSENLFCDWRNNSMFCILKDTLDTEQIVRILDNADLANLDGRCVVCGEKDADEKRNHTSECLIGVIENYLRENGFID